MKTSISLGGVHTCIFNEINNRYTLMFLVNIKIEKDSFKNVHSHIF